ncbi:hypothetical protein BAE44_0015185, partial [Dichanthelium oligosanthes]
LRLASQWIHQPIILESDCARVVDRSQIGFYTEEAKKLSQQGKIIQVKPERSDVTHVLAQLARRNAHAAVWLQQTPQCIAHLVDHDCNFSHD